MHPSPYSLSPAGAASRIMYIVTAIAVAVLMLALSSARPVEGAPSPAAPGAAPAPAAVSCPGATYTVIAGDGWWLIAYKNGITMASLLEANSATTATFLSPGQQVCLPSGASPTPTTAPSTPTTQPPSGAISLQQFPVQGPCNFTDSYGAPRSGGRSHEGVDILAKANQFIYAVADGTLTKQYFASTSALSGNGWRLTRADGTYFFYAHLSAFAPGLKIGSTVKAGQIIGWNGMTGNAGTPHLHFEVHPYGGASINPTGVVRAVNGCSTTTVPPQPNGVIPTYPTGTTTPTTAPATTAPATTAPATTAPATTAPATTTPTTTPPATLPNVGAGNRWGFIAPTTAFDSRGTKLVARTAKSISIANLPGIPANTPGVMVRVVARNVADRGFINVHPCAADGTTSSALSIRPNRLNATTTITAVSQGTFCVTSSVATDVRIEIIAVLVGDGAQVAPMTARRALDTRTANAPIAANATRGLTPSKLGVPLGTKAVTISVTLVRPAVAGSIGVGPCGGTPWIVPYTAGQLQVLSGLIRTNDAGVCITTTTEAHVVVDVTAMWGTPQGAKALLPNGPKRTFDSRTGNAIGTGTTTISLPGLPAGATQASVTLTLIGGANSASLFAWPCSQPKPTATIGAVEPGSTATAQIVLAGSQLCLSSNGTLNAVVDVTGAG